MFFKSFSIHGFNVKVIVTRTYRLLHYALLSVTLTFRWFLWVRLQGHIMHMFFGWYRFEKLSRSLFLTPSIITYYDWKDSQIDIVLYIFVNIKVTKMRELFVCLNSEIIDINCTSQQESATLGCPRRGVKVQMPSTGRPWYTIKRWLWTQQQWEVLSACSGFYLRSTLPQRFQ